MIRDDELRYAPPPGGDEVWKEPMPVLEPAADADVPVDDQDDDAVPQRMARRAGADTTGTVDPPAPPPVTPTYPPAAPTPRQRTASGRSVAPAREAPPKETQFLDFRFIDAMMVFLIRLTSVGVLGFSFLGSIAALDTRSDGGIRLVLDSLPWVWTVIPRETLLVALGAQVYLTLMQWWTAPPRGTWGRLLRLDVRPVAEHKLYFGHLAADVILTTLGWHSVVVPVLEAQYTAFLLRVAGTAAPNPSFILAWLSAIIIFTVVATWPESRIVRRGAA